jgi:hypothetical protein
MLSDSIRGIPYLWSAIQMASVAPTICEDSLQKLYRLNVLADVSFLWQKSLENDSTSPSPSLQLSCLHVPLKIALLANVNYIRHQKQIVMLSLKIYIRFFKILRVIHHFLNLKYTKFKMFLWKCYKM